MKLGKIFFILIQKLFHSQENRSLEFKSIQIS